MKTLNLFFVGILCFCIQLNAQKTQDIIYRTNGDSLLCKIVKVDSTSIYFESVFNKRKVSSFISKTEVTDYKTGVAISRPAPSNTNNSNSGFCLSIDPIGFITMGPVITGEILMQKPGNSAGFGLYSGLRITNLGLATVVLLDGGDMKTSFTIPLGFRVYTKTRTKADGFFLGPHFEWGKSKFNSGSENQVRAFGGQLGYKWVFPNRFTLELNYGIGVIQTKWKEHTETETVYYSGSGYSSTTTTTYHTEATDWETLAFVPYMISLKLGKTF